LANDAATQPTLLDQLVGARRAMLREIETIPESDMTKPISGDWTLKDLLAHVSSWDEMSWLDLERAARGHIPFVLAWKPEATDHWNQFLMSGRRGFSLEQVKHELMDRRGRLLAVLESNPGLAEGPLAKRLFEVLISHDSGHAEEIRNWRANGSN
jgi:hypothetical protein